MCRSTLNHGFYQPDRDRLKIKALYLRFLISNSRKPLPESLTLLYLPRISGSPLKVNDSKIRSDLPAYITLHRVRSAEKRTREAVFASRERVRVGEGVQFEVYMREEKVLKGVFRKNEGEDWNLEVKCALEGGDGTECGCSTEVEEADVSVVGEGHVAIDEKVEMVVRRKKCRGFLGLEEIPEERDGSDCCCCGGGDDDEEEEGEEEGMESGSDGGDSEVEREEIETEMEGVRWAVDVGIWVMCLGVGYLVSKASTKSLRRTRFL